MATVRSAFVVGIILLTPGCTTPDEPEPRPTVVTREIDLAYETSYRVSVQLFPGESVEWWWNTTAPVRHYATVFTAGAADLIKRSNDSQTDHANQTGYGTNGSRLELEWVRQRPGTVQFSFHMVGNGTLLFAG